MKRTPMKRTPFARRQVQNGVQFIPRIIPAERPERIKPVAQPLARPVRYAEPANDPGTALTKPEAHRNPRLLRMAKGESCLLTVPGVCNHDRATTVAAHSNWAEHGKAGARKADDCYHVHACSACHSWLDQGPAPAAEKRAAWNAGFRWMVDIWRGMVSGLLDTTPKERAAAQWALDRIAADCENRTTSYGEPST